MAGIIPVFAIGNSGPLCATAAPPGSYNNCIAVGATDINDAVPYFSSRGPAFKEIALSTENQSSCINLCVKEKAVGICVDPLIKPEVCAPGKNVNSSWNTSDTSYNTISGKSVASYPILLHQCSHPKISQF